MNEALLLKTKDSPRLKINQFYKNYAMNIDRINLNIKIIHLSFVDP